MNEEREKDVDTQTLKEAARTATQRSETIRKDVRDIKIGRAHV